MSSGGNQTGKKEARHILADLPDDASLEDVQYHLYVLQHIERGRRDIDGGRVLSQDEVGRRMARWSDGSNGSPAQPRAGDSPGWR